MDAEMKLIIEFILSSSHSRWAKFVVFLGELSLADWLASYNTSMKST